MIKVIEVLCYLFNKKNFWIYLTIHNEKLYPYRIKNQKYFSIYLHFDELNSKFEYKEKE